MIKKKLKCLWKKLEYSVTTSLHIAQPTSTFTPPYANVSEELWIIQTCLASKITTKLHFALRLNLLLSLHQEGIFQRERQKLKTKMAEASCERKKQPIAQPIHWHSFALDVHDNCYQFNLGLIVFYWPGTLFLFMVWWHTAKRCGPFTLFFSHKLWLYNLRVVQVFSSHIWKFWVLSRNITP